MIIIIIIVPDVTGVTEKEKTQFTKMEREKKNNKSLIDLGYDEYQRDRAHSARARFFLSFIVSPREIFSAWVDLMVANTDDDDRIHVRDLLLSFGLVFAFDGQRR